MTLRGSAFRNSTTTSRSSSPNASEPSTAMGRPCSGFSCGFTNPAEIGWSRQEYLSAGMFIVVSVARYRLERIATQQCLESENCNSWKHVSARRVARPSLGFRTAIGPIKQFESRGGSGEATGIAVQLQQITHSRLPGLL